MGREDQERRTRKRIRFEKTKLHADVGLSTGTVTVPSHTHRIRCVRVTGELPVAIQKWS